jgi:hypothetical protein
VAQVNDSIYGLSTSPKYDIVTIATGDREDPLDFLTQNLSPAETAVHNRIYALRDFNIDAMGTGGSITYPATIKDAHLINVTSNQFECHQLGYCRQRYPASKGWYIDLAVAVGENTGPHQRLCWHALCHHLYSSQRRHRSNNLRGQRGAWDGLFDQYPEWRCQLRPEWRWRR